MLSGRLVGGVDQLQQGHLDARGQSVDHVGDALGVERVERPLRHTLGDQPREHRPKQALFECDDSFVQVGVLRPQQRYRGGQPLGRSCRHLDVETGLQQCVQPIQRVTPASGRGGFHGGELVARTAVGQSGYQRVLRREPIVGASTGWRPRSRPGCPDVTCRNGTCRGGRPVPVPAVVVRRHPTASGVLSPHSLQPPPPRHPPPELPHVHPRPQPRHRERIPRIPDHPPEHIPLPIPRRPRQIRQ